MKFYAYIPNKDGSEPTGTSKRLLFELKTRQGARRRVRKYLGNNAILCYYTNWYDERTYTII